jgi:septum formation protein
LESQVIYLASRSPRRQQLLQQLGVSFEVLDVDVPEQRGDSESAIDYVARVAREKAQAGLSNLAQSGGCFVIGADTEVVLDGVVFGKPTDAEDAKRMLRSLSSRTHEVISVVCCAWTQGFKHVTSISQVRFAELTDQQIQAYVETGEPFGKAGAYAIQGRAAAFVAHLNGSYSGVMGLPLHETSNLLAGIS